MSKLNINGMKVSEKLDAFRFTEQDADKACHIAQAADEARELEKHRDGLLSMNTRLLNENRELMVQVQDAWNDGQIGNPPPLSKDT